MYSDEMSGVVGEMFLSCAGAALLRMKDLRKVSARGRQGALGVWLQVCTAGERSSGEPETPGRNWKYLGSSHAFSSQQQMSAGLED